MSLRCLVIATLIFVIESASINSRNIPVEVVYDQSNSFINANRNLDAKIQISADDLLRLKLSDEIINAENEHEEQVQEVNEGVKNLDEKVQLSAQELAANSVKKLVVPNDEQSKEVPLEESSNNNLNSLLKKAEEIAYSGISSIRNNMEKASEVIANAKPGEDTWEKLNQTVQNFFIEQYKRVSLKQSEAQANNTDFFQGVVNNFQTTIGSFMGNFISQNNQKPQGSEDEQTGQEQNGFQSVVNFFATGFNQVVNNMNNLNGPSGTGSEDTGVDSNNSNFFGTVVNQVQQFFQNNNPAQAANNQSDTGVQPPNNGGPGVFFQQIWNQFTQTTAKPVQGDEGTASSTTPASNIIAGISQAFQNVNPFGQQSTQAPGDTGSNPITSGAQAIGSQITGAAGNNPITSGAQAIGSQLTGQTGQNPITSGAQAIGSQLAGATANNTLTSGAQAIGSQLAEQTGQNPITSGAQAIGSQVTQGSNPITSGAQAIGSQLAGATVNNTFTSGAQAIGSQIAEQAGQNPITSGAQAVYGQIGQLASGQGGNPLDNIPNPLASTTTASTSLKLKGEEKLDTKKKIEKLP